MDISEVSPTTSFARHETFHLKYGWLKKCHDFVSRGKPFNDEAPTELGVGKNMAKSIRFWGMAAKIIEPKKSAGGELTVTEFGNKIFRDGGLDPYLEHPETSWVLHWSLLSKPTLLPVWWLLLNKMGRTRMKVADMVEFAESEVGQTPGWDRIRPSSIKKDVDVFMHTYAIGKSAKTSIEDYLDSPLRGTCLLQKDTTDGQFRFASGKKPGITPELVAYICLDFLRVRGTSSSTISMNILATELGGPGQLLRLNEYEIGELLYKVADTHANLISIREVNGEQHLVFNDLEKSSEIMLENIYGNNVYKITARGGSRRKKVVA